MKRVFLAGLMACICSVASAGSDEFADKLAEVIGSESACQMTIDRQALQSLIERRVKPDDPSFTRDLHYAMQLVLWRVEKNDDTQLLAHCTQVRRVAKAAKLVAP